MTVRMSEIELALQVLAANMRGDRETVTRTIQEHEEIGSALIGIACSFAELLATQNGWTTERLFDEMLLDAAKRRLAEDD